MAQYALIMLLAGIGIPILAALNAALGTRLGNPAAAAVVLFMVALLSAAVVFALSGGHGMDRVTAAPRHLFLAGALVAFYVLSITFIAPHFGIGNAVFFVLIGHLISAAAIDQFGLFGAPAVALGPARIGGIALMAAGVWLTQQA